MVVLAAHRRNLPSGVRDAMVVLWQGLRISRVRQLAKRVLYSCLVCRRHKFKMATETSASIPSENLADCNNFQVVAIEFAGPFFLREDALKMCILLSTLSTARALPLVIFWSLAVDFLMVFRRFMAWHETPRTIFSDNVMTLKGAEKELKRLCMLSSSQEIYDFTWNRIIVRKFNAEAFIGWEHSGNEWFVPWRSLDYENAWQNLCKKLRIKKNPFWSWVCS